MSKTWIQVLLLGGAMVMVAGCRSDDDARSKKAEAFDVTIVSPAPDPLARTNTTQIAATVFIPEHRPGESYPLIVHSHGWGGSRVEASEAVPDSDPAASIFTRIDRQVYELWRRGYAVISFDERGWGDSGGQARTMDPEFETRDAIAVVDWAVANLDVARDSGGDPLIGTIGGSYGGAFQLLLAALDPRIDAITPVATWYDLNTSLAPGHVLLKAYSGGLCILAEITGARLDPMIEKSCREGYYILTNRFAEQVSEDVHEFLGAHGVSHFERLQRAGQFSLRPIDALFIHGQRDVLFNVNQVVENARYLRAAGGDVRVLTDQNGHILRAPFASQGPAGPSACGALDDMAAIRAWFDAKLRGRAEAIRDIPRLCISLDNTRAVHLRSMPRGDAAFTVTIPSTRVSGMNRNTQGGRPIFIPLAEAVAEEGLVLAGVPTADLRVRPAGADPQAVAFVGLGVQAANGALRLVDEQVRPLRNGEHTGVELVAVGEALEPGDRVGVLLYGDFDQFEYPNGANFAANLYEIEGSVRLPILRAPRGP